MVRTVIVFQCCAGSLSLLQCFHDKGACGPPLQTGEEGEEVMADFKCKLYRSACSRS